MPKHARARAPALAFDPVLTRRAASHQRHHIQFTAKAMYTGQRACQATRMTSQVPLAAAAWATWPPRPLRHMDDECTHALLPLSTLINILVRLQCGDRMRAIAIRATTTPTLDGRDVYMRNVVEVSVMGLNLPRPFGPFRYRVILGLLLFPVFVQYGAIVYCSLYILVLGVSSQQFTSICMSIFQVQPRSSISRG